MDDRKATNVWLAAAAPAVGCVLQVIALVRYVRRLPDDWVGIGIYSATIVAFAVAGIVGYARWRIER